MPNGLDHIDRYVYRYLFAAVVVLLTSGTVFFHYVEKLRWLDAYYFCVVTLSTVGYGDIVPKTDLGKFGDTIYIMLGVGVLTTFISATVRRRGDRMRAKLGVQGTGQKSP